MSAFLISVSQNAKAQTSRELRAWAEENLDNYRNRTEASLLPFPKQRALYNLLNPAEKAGIWQYKWQDIKNSQRISAAEKKELRKLYKFAKPQLFDNETTKIDKRFEQAYKDFQKTMTENFGWTDKEMFLYCECALTEDEIRNYCQTHGLDIEEFL